MRTAFNGFGNGETVIVADEPMATAYGTVAQPAVAASAI
jgi:ornithine decarboxylase